MMWLMIAQGVLIALLIFALLTMYDHIKMFRFLVENFVNTVQKLCDNNVRENKNVAANINAVKEAIKNSNGISDYVKSLDGITKSLGSTANIIKTEVTKFKKG